MFDKLKQVKELRDQAKQLQETLSHVTVTKSSSNGDQMIMLDGNMNVIELKTGSPDKADDLKKLINDAIQEVQKKAAETMRQTGGFNIPGLS